MTVHQPIDIFMAKGPVCICHPRAAGCLVGRWCGPQKKARHARAALESMGILLPPGLDIALSHALDVGEGRAEFDAIMGRWMEERCK